MHSIPSSTGSTGYDGRYTRRTHIVAWGNPKSSESAPITQHFRDFVGVHSALSSGQDWRKSIMYTIIKDKWRSAHQPAHTRETYHIIMDGMCIVPVPILCGEKDLKAMVIMATLLSAAKNGRQIADRLQNPSFFSSLSLSPPLQLRRPPKIMTVKVFRCECASDFVFK